jgi:hypothetical protein
MIKFILLFALSLIASLHAEEKHVKLADKLIYKYCKEITKANKALRVTGTGGRMMGDIQEIAISFFLYKTITISEARCLYVSMVEQFLNLVNNDPNIRPYLREYPFTAKNFDLIIGVIDPNTKTISEQGVAAIFIINKKEKISYASYNRQTDKLTVQNGGN